MNNLLGYTKSISYKAGDLIELYSHFPCTYAWNDLYLKTKPNQSVKIDPTYQSIQCVINQSTSTPGLVWNGIGVTKGSKYLTINWDCEGLDLNPFVRDLSGNVLYWIGMTNNLVQIKPGSICISLAGQSIPNQLNIYLLAQKGTFSLGSKFILTNINFNFTNSPNVQLVTSLYTHKKTLVSKQQFDSPISQKFIPNSFALGCGWTRPGFFSIPNKINSGYYFLKLEFKSQIHWVSLIIKPKTGFEPKPKILVLSNTNKFNAYNTWAGPDGSISLYTYNPTPYYQTHRVLAFEGTDGIKQGAPIVSNFVHMERPNTTASSYIQTYWTSDINTFQFFNDHIYGEMHLPNYLDRMGLSFDVISDQDMSSLTKTDLSGYSIFMMHVHPEYWDLAQLRVLNLINQMGIGIMYLAGNGIYWKCTWVGNQMEVRKDRKYHLDGTQGGQFGELTFPGLANGYQIIKIYYSKMYNMDLNPPVPYKLFNFPSWIVQGLNLDISGGSVKIGFKNLNSRALESGTAGWEVDKLFNQSDTKYVIGSSPDGLSHIVWVDRTGSTGPVFAAGSIIYTGSLAVDSGISGLTWNVIKKLI